MSVLVFFFFSLPAPTIACGCVVADKVRHVDNEALRNLMMSWYFAGYYTGLYEGQQQAQQQQNGGQQS